MKRPKASITSPQYRFTLESVRAARSDGAENAHADQYQADDGEEEARRHS